RRRPRVCPAGKQLGDVHCGGEIPGEVPGWPLPGGRYAGGDQASSGDYGGSQDGDAFQESGNDGGGRSEARDGSEAGHFQVPGEANDGRPGDSAGHFGGGEGRRRRLERDTDDGDAAGPGRPDGGFGERHADCSQDGHHPGAGVDHGGFRRRQGVGENEHGWPGSAGSGRTGRRVVRRFGEPVERDRMPASGGGVQRHFPQFLGPDAEGEAAGGEGGRDGAGDGAGREIRDLEGGNRRGGWRRRPYHAMGGEGLAGDGEIDGSNVLGGRRHDVGGVTAVGGGEAARSTRA